MGHSKKTLHFLLTFWPLGKILNWIGRKPPFSIILHPLFDRKSNHAVILPINQIIQGTQSVALPYELLFPLIEKASDRFILDHCLCRQAEHCQEFPTTIGCLFLGEAVRDIHPTMGRHSDLVSSLEHVKGAMQAGLTPMVIHSAFDAYVLGIPYKRMLAICFCCDCCCTVRQGLRLGPSTFLDTVERLPGLSVIVSDRCCGCGSCVEVCHTQAIQLVDGEALISALCKGCGRCVTVCPNSAIHIEIEDIALMSRLLFERVSERTDIGI